MAGRVCVVHRIQPNGSPHAYRSWKLSVPRIVFRGMYQMSMNENTQPQGPSFLEMLGHGDWLFNQPPIMQPQTTGMYNPEQMMGYAGSIQSYGEPCSYGGGSSTAQHDIGPLQHDEPPPITQPAQDYDDVDLRGVEVVR
uniref:Uncharacterized protein n=1 Tax=Oryza rufipogon TaxID=4529 RepID=A0A0E0N9S5_ORYRU